MNQALELRDYQRDIVTRIFDAWQTHRSVMVQMPTGTGKTHVLAAVVNEELRMKNEESCGREESWGREERIGKSEESNTNIGGVWIVAHRKELVAQIEETIQKIMPDHFSLLPPDSSSPQDFSFPLDSSLFPIRSSLPQDSSFIKVLSIQWLSRHWEDIEGMPSLIIIDEAHHALAETYRELWRRYPEAMKLGMTATPCRMNRRGFTDLFDVLLTSWSVAEFIRKGRLSLFDYVSIRPDSEDQRLIDSLEKRGADGDYQFKEMNAVLNRRPSIERLYQSVVSYAKGKKGIVYAISIEHARSIAAYYNEMGISTAVIDSKTPAEERRRIIEDFRKRPSGERPSLRILVNVDVFSEGFDCPDVEFVQLARPTLSLSKYLQQVGRGLRRSAGKETCILIDNVGLYRMFGLPTVAWDWEAMFRGRMAGKGCFGCHSRSSVETIVPGTHDALSESDGGMTVVVSHDRLLNMLEDQGNHCPVQQAKAPALKPWQDTVSGLWGLRCGHEKITGAVYEHIFDIRYDMVAVRLRGMTCGVTDLSGTVVLERNNCKSMKFIAGHFLVTMSKNGKEHYVDLNNMQTYDHKPEVRRYGNVELLKVGYVYYSRTKNVYVNRLHIDRFHILRQSFYLAVFDSNVPVEHAITDNLQSGCKSGYVCLLDGDNDTFYWMHCRLADGSIIVWDSEGRYYHVMENQEKQLIGHDGSPQDIKACQTEIIRLSGQARDNVRMREAEREEKKRKALGEYKDVQPFRAGIKWGLKSGDRIIVPPIYRNVKTPVGRYCAVEKSYSQWGVIAIDGRVMIEPKYPEVDVVDNGTAVLTFVTGKKKTVTLSS